MSEWNTLIAVVAALIAVFSLIQRTLDKAVSIREYEEARQAAIRESDQIQRKIELLEQTRPTTGELEARLDKNNINSRK